MASLATFQRSVNAHLHRGPAHTVFHVVLIKPTRYDDNGYAIHWSQSPLPSNALACVYGIVEDCRTRAVLGPDVRIEITAFDESNCRVPVGRLTRSIRKSGGHGLIGLVGVQTNQFPRALDLARQFRAAGLPVCIGGFHVSGCLAMLGRLTPELDQARAAGISLFAGEAEECRFDQVLRDAFDRRHGQIYNYSASTPQLGGQPLPRLPGTLIERTMMRSSSFDLGRGCPFECSFCCIINVQGRKSRFRTPDDLEAIIRANAAMGVREYFVTDDNLARNKQWEPLFDRLIALREKHGFRFSLQVQVDTLTHRIPGFIDKAVRAGVEKVFIGLENINPDNLAAVKKRQNRITEYRRMLLDWKRYPVVITCGYIAGFPNDTRESILRDIDIIKRELPIDILYLTQLTPLPGSEDHKKALAQGTWIDPDLNKYDLSHRVTRHARMPVDEVDRVFREAWDRFYTSDHIETVLRRAAALGSDKKLTTASRLFYYGRLTRIYGEYSLDMGLVRRRYRNERRSGLGREPWPVFLFRLIEDGIACARAYVGFRRLRKRALDIWKSPDRYAYRDMAITPPSDQDFESRDLFTATRGGAAAVARHRAQTRAAEVQFDAAE